MGFETFLSLQWQMVPHYAFLISGFAFNKIWEGNQVLKARQFLEPTRMVFEGKNVFAHLENSRFLTVFRIW